MGKIRTFATWVVAIALSVSIGGVALAQPASGPVHNGDYFASGKTVTITGTVNGDVYVAGGTVNIDATVNGDVLAAGGTVTVSGVVTGSVRATAGSLILNGEIDRNVSAAAGTIDVSPNAKLMGNLLAAAGSVTSAGSVGGNLMAAAGTLDILGPVGGYVDAKVGTIKVGSTASTGGSISYTSEDGAQVDSGAKIGGPVTHHVARHEAPDPSRILLMLLYALLTWLIVGLVIITLMPRFVGAAAEVLTRLPWPSLGLGFAGFFLIPILVLVLVVTLIGIPLAIVTLVLYALLILLGNVVVSLAIGRFLGERSKAWDSVYTSLAVGIVIYWALTSIPVIGAISAFIGALFGLGAVVQAIYARRQAL